MCVCVNLVCSRVPPLPSEWTSLCWFLLLWFPVFPELLAVVPAGLHVSIIFFCGVVVLFSSVATGFFFFNAFGRPYETLQGPVGLYLWTCVSGEACVCVFWRAGLHCFTLPPVGCAGLCSCLVLVLFAAEVKLHHLSDRISNFSEVSFTFQTFSEEYDRCFWLFFLVFLIHGLNVVLIRLTGVRFPLQEPKEVDLSGGAADLMY